MGLTVPELLKLLEALKAARVLRRIGASLHHVRVGYSANALAAWLTPEKNDVELANSASFPWVSHCYIRDIIESNLPFDWPYTLYTMLHAPDSASLDARLKTMHDVLSPEDSVALPTVKELKKTRLVLKS
jgi:DNA-binding Lrp family transcriptional regulator